MSATLTFISVSGPPATDGAPTRIALVLHGILGSARNWLAFIRRLAERTPGVDYLLVDLRNHGESQGQSPPHTIAACAGDLTALCAERGVKPDVVIGHSFGGKVALEFARTTPGPMQVWALDSVPGLIDKAARGAGRPVGTSAAGNGYGNALPSDSPVSHEVLRVIAALRTLALPIESRAALQEALRARGLGETFAAWMTTNLRPQETGGFTWRFNLDAIETMLASYFKTDLWPFIRQVPAEKEVHLVRAERSDRWSPPDLVQLADAQATGGVHLHVLENAGHWLHVDNPEGLRTLLAASISP